MTCPLAVLPNAGTGPGMVQHGEGSGHTTIIKADGTETAGPYTATWTCKNDDVVMNWSHGYTDRLRLLRDGTHLEGTNGTVIVSGDRR